ncbi:MAG: hypothetical protein CME62_07660 [Halobacteriovoraceae bacterium]|nr:hypothetical protein [Halobacteriovoraceae bacterium]|tara:strand:- start:3407 stop:4150 length:744 start_codon:yes stop_codon:yes gene_type:complete
MKEFTLFCVLTFIFAYTAGQFGLWKDIDERSKVVHNYEYKALELAKEVRLLRVENQELKTKINKLQDKIDFQKNSTSGISRTMASVPKKSMNDLVEFDVYKWSAEKLLGVGEQSLHFGKKQFDGKKYSSSQKHYEKSAQYYHALLTHYKDHQAINDRVLFEAGIAAYESKNHYDWSKKHFKKVVDRYPASKYRLKAKMWLALSHFYLGEREQFVEIVDEFHKKYSNSDEYTKVLSKYYEELDYKYNR